MNMEINADGLTKCYHNRPVVSSIHFQVRQGQIFAFLGPNGAGKSTTMKILSTLLSKTSGTVHIDGLDLDLEKEQIKNRIGVVFQEDVLDRDLTVYQNLLYRGGLYIDNKKRLEARIRKVSGLLCLQDILHKKHGDCSGGQRRLAQLARALLPEPKLLILDEPTTGLDPVTRKKVWEFLILLRDRFHLTLFFSTHYLEEASAADQFCILKNGVILFCGSMKQIAGSDLNKFYLDLLS